jgi:hypothetical protein
MPAERLKLHNLALNFLQLGGAILNIITNKNAKNYLSATYSSTSLQSYNGTVENEQQHLAECKNKYFGWN